MSLILKCDNGVCENNTYNYDEVIWTASDAIIKAFEIDHICNTCVKKRLETINLSRNTDEQKIYFSEEVEGIPTKTVIYSDGACKGNPGPSGSGLAIYRGEDDPIIKYGDYDSNGTNNTAELLAMLAALNEAVKELKEVGSVSIKSDSQYSINCVTKWAKGWESKNWTKKGGEIKNLELIKKCYFLYEEITENCDISYVKAHSGIEGNELADRAAGCAIKEELKEYKILKYENIQNILRM